MNSISSPSSVSSSRRKWAYKFIFIPFTIILLISSSVVPALAYDAYSNIYYDSTVMNKDLNNSNVMSFEDSFDGLELYINNSEPSIFEVGRHYTFDVVMGVWFGDYSIFDTTMQQAINSLVTSGYTEEWFAHYVYGFDIGFYDNSGYYTNLSPEQYYAPQSETVIYYGNQFYSDMTDIVHSASGTILNHSNNRLYMQIKIHFDFDCTVPIDAFSAFWSPYQFSPADSSGAVIFQTTFDVSNVISYDYTAIQGMNIIAYDIKAQIAGMESSLTSSLQQLLDMQDRYWNILLGSCEGMYEYDVFGEGILYTIYNLLDTVESNILKINTSLNTIKSSVSTISTNTTTIRNLLTGTTTTFWDFLEGNFDLLHEDLVDIKNYLDQTDKSSSMGSDVGNSIGSMMDIAGGGDIQLNDIDTPEFADQSSWNWFSQAIDLTDFCLPFLVIALSFGIFKAVFN